ncbi:capsule assembly Wzi family protein [Catalinimonas sp. 4WD22]|uniref:capsule assembly Wzi family protein n=1 Tax=Catalinimonas locisalis TaxID=3133978 RepID=UPI0031017F8C
MYTSLATQDYQSFWLTANQYDIISDHKVDATLMTAVNYQHKYKSLTIKTGASLVANFFSGRYRAVELYGKVKFKHWQIVGGREMKKVGEVDSLLSSGSLAISSNALPIPTLGIRTNNYIPFPFVSQSWLKYKFSWLHGWMGQNRVLKGAYLHEKSLYFKIGEEKLNFYAGFVHFAIWGINNNQGKVQSELQDYLRVVVGAQSGNSGDHMGVWDWGMNYSTSQFALTAYTQSIYERGYVPQSLAPAKIKGTRILSRDRLLGMSFRWQKKNSINRMVLEYINTTYQGGKNAANGIFNYYNDATYLSGWTYQGRIIGTPLFISSKQLSNFYQKEPSEWSIASNRIKSIHIGVSGFATEQLTYKTFFTYTKHFGNYHNDAFFSPVKTVLSTLLEVKYQLNNSLSVMAISALDWRALSNNQGLMVGLEWH